MIQLFLDRPSVGAWRRVDGGTESMPLRGIAVGEPMRKEAAEQRNVNNIRQAQALRTMAVIRYAGHLKCFTSSDGAQ
jgi:hypothetical protein